MPTPTAAPTKTIATQSPDFFLEAAIALVGVDFTTGRLRTTASMAGLFRSICLTPGESTTGSRKTLTFDLSGGAGGFGGGELLAWVTRRVGRGDSEVP